MDTNVISGVHPGATIDIDRKKHFWSTDCAFASPVNYMQAIRCDSNSISINNNVWVICNPV